MLPSLVATFQRVIPKCSLQDLSNTAAATSDLGCLDDDTARTLDACFRRMLVPGQCSSLLDPEKGLQSDVKSVARLLHAYRGSGYQPTKELLAHIRNWVIAAVDADSAARKGGSTPGRGRVLGPPGAAANLLTIWANSRWSGKRALPMPAVWALARSAAEGAGVAAGGFEGRALSSALFALGRLVGEGQGRGGDGALGGTIQTPNSLRAAIARWAGLAVARISPAAPFALVDLGWAVWGVHASGFTPDATTAAAAAEKLAAALPREQGGKQLLAIAGLVSRPLAAWHQLGLVPELAPAARALAARSLEMAAACRDERALRELVGYLKALYDAAKLPMPPPLG